MANHGLRTDRVYGARLDGIVFVDACLRILNLYLLSGKNLNTPGSGLMACENLRAMSLERTKPGIAMLLCRQRPRDRHPVTHRSQGSSSLDFTRQPSSPSDLNLHSRQSLAFNSIHSNLS